MNIFLRGSHIHEQFSRFRELIFFLCSQIEPPKQNQFLEEINTIWLLPFYGFFFIFQKRHKVIVRILRNKFAEDNIELHLHRVREKF